VARFGRKAPAQGDVTADVDYDELRAQAAAAMEQAQRLASEDPVVRARAVHELRAENAAQFASGERRPSLVGWYRGPGDAENVERYWDGVEWTDLVRDLTVPVTVPDVLPYSGEIIWLSAEQGGRPDGPPRPAGEHAEYQGDAFVPPSIMELGLTPIVLRGLAPGAWRSLATAAWLTHDGSGPGSVRPGSLIVICEGTARVGYFAVTAVQWPEIVEEEPALLGADA
jgi:hypothetical protein